MSTLTKQQLDELQALLDAGTQGEWREAASNGIRYGAISSDEGWLLQSWDKCEEDFANAENNRLLVVALHNQAQSLLEAAKERLELQEWKSQALQVWEGWDSLVESLPRDVRNRLLGKTQSNVIGTFIKELQEQNAKLRASLIDMTAIARIKWGNTDSNVNEIMDQADKALNQGKEPA